MTIEIDNADKLFFADAGYSKGDLADYYQRIAPQMLPHIKDRPLTLHRFPDGINGVKLYPEERGRALSRLDRARHRRQGRRPYYPCACR